MKQLKVLFAIFAFIFSNSAFADVVEIGGLFYSLSWPSDSECTITSGRSGKYSGNIYIPAKVTYNGKTYNVTSVQSQAFAFCPDITSFTVESGNTKLCSESGVLFDKNKATLIQYPACSEASEYTLPASVKIIGGTAFSSTRKLKTVHCSEGLLEIKFAAFSQSSVEMIHLPESLANLSEDCFISCSQMTNIIVDDRNPNYSSVDGVLYNKDKTRIIAYPGGANRTSYKIPEGVTSIAADAFSFCTTLETVFFPSSVTEICEHPFQYNSRLNSIIVDDNNPNYCSVDGVLYNKAKTV